ncbi:MAG: hypothetical protein Q8T11_17350 [Elusimicrobiota bacterium]|nr:hypothetical protein [Elusimicrobiota bacterium]
MKSNVVRNACGASLGLLTVLIWASAAEKPRTAAPPAQARAEAGASPEALIRRWPPRSRAAAALLLETYGLPDQFDENSLAWFGNGEWKRTVVHRKLSRRDGSGRTKDFLEQTVGYLVPQDKLADLERFHQLLEVSPIAGEMTFASDSEAKNRLAMNLADEIATGKRGPADARAAYLKTSRLAVSGKSSPYLEALQFEPDNTRVMIPTGADR